MTKNNKKTSKTPPSHHAAQKSTTKDATLDHSASHPTTQTSTHKDVKTSKRATRYFIIGVFLTLFNYVLYAFLANVILKDNNLLWLASLIGTLITTLLAYLLHSKITWKERHITKTSIYKFFIWNLLLAFVFYPILTQLFSLITPLYEFAYNISSAIHLPFTYDFVLSTGAFVLASCITMILNYLFYDKFVFGKRKDD